MNDGGRIVIIGSNTAIRTAFPGGSVYSMTKAALTGLVRGAAIDLAPRAIKVNNVQPGPIATDMTSALGEFVKPLIPLKRMVTYRRSPASSLTSRRKKRASSPELALPSTADTSPNRNENIEREEAHGATERVRSGESASEGDTPFFSARLCRHIHRRLHAHH